MVDWTYKCYDERKSETLWRKWYDDHPEMHGKHDSVFEALETKDSWAIPHAKPLTNGDGLIEVRLFRNVQWRIFGFYGPERRCFIVVLIGLHKGRVYTPKDAIKTSKARMQEIRRNPEKAVNCERPE